MAATDQPGLNAAYVAQLHADYLDAPASVPDEWRQIFESNGGQRGRRAPAPAAAVAERRRRPPRPSRPTPTPVAAPVDTEFLGGVAAAMALVKAYRMHGHLAARLDPLGSEPMGDPALDETRLHPPLTPELQARIPARLLRLSVPGETLLEALPRLREVYTGSIAYEIEHISDHAERVWLRKSIESGRFREPPAPELRVALLRRLTQVEGFEQYLRRSFLGQKQFSLEGLDSLVPMLDEAIELVAEAGAHEVVIGMAHRGRLNALVHTVGRSYESVLREFEGERSYDALVVDPEGGSGDVKYHLPATGTRGHGPARSTSRSHRTRATSRRSTPSSKGGRAPSSRTARAAPGCTTPRSRSRSSSTAMRPSPDRAWWRRRSTCRASTATRPAGRST